MQIFIVTRFSLRIQDWEKRVGLSEERRSNWFQYRAKIFNHATLPCVKNQTIPVSRIYLLMDDGDRDLYDRYIDKCDIVEPVFTKPEVSNEIVTERISEQANGPILVGRLDSDDIIAADYFEQMSSCLEGVGESRALAEGKVILKARNGYITDLKYIQPFFDDSPSFLATYYPTFIGPLEMGGNHLKINTWRPIACDSAKWARLIHGSNVGNNFKRKRVWRVNGETWPNKIPRVNVDVVDKFLFSNDAGAVDYRRDQVQLWLQLQPGGSIIVRSWVRAVNVWRRLTSA